MASTKGYKGISFPFRVTSRGGIAVTSTSATDLSHIEEALRQLIGTARGERIMEAYGTERSPALFGQAEEMNPQVALLKLYVEEALARDENRVKLEYINVAAKETEDEEDYLEVNLGIWVEQYGVFKEIKNVKVG